MTPLARLIAAAEAVEDAWDCAEGPSDDPSRRWFQERMDELADVLAEVKGHE